MSLFFRTKVEFVSPLPLAECVTRLQARIDYMEGFGRQKPKRVDPNHPVMGTLKDSTLSITRNRFKTVNPFPTFLRAKLESNGTATTIEGAFGMHPVAIAIILAWMVMFFIMSAIIGAITYIELQKGNKPELLMVTILSFVLCWTIFATTLFRYLQRDEPQFLTQFMVDTLKAYTRP